jgi:hypothetical protein
MISYRNVLQVDTALAESALRSLDPTTGAVTPSHFVHGRFVHFTCDNIDIKDSSFYGKKSFHATQLAAWQRGPAVNMELKNIRPSKTTTLQVPDVLEELIQANIIDGLAEPKCTENTNQD